MRIVHHIGFRASPAQLRELDAMGVNVPEAPPCAGGGEPLVVFDIGEDHPNWEALAARLRAWDVFETVRAEFDKQEVAAARWLGITALHHGYPQPHDDIFGYREATYDLADWCETCGVGMRQKAPFQMKREPKWGRRAIMQLHWVYDELFVTPEVWSRVFKQAGVACRPVLNTKGAELQTVVQLVVDVAMSVMADGLPAAQCERCGRTKYLPFTRGPFPAFRSEPTVSMVRTVEYFGDGGQADRPLIVSQAIARALTDASVRGAELWPVAD
jgi:hypothetical protein